ncbi:NUDIX domain-containing protein [Nonomuraea sp. NPDC046570]|uniref:NUDIX hydrolase n=1 Tax=Nonomuraea sp. NPDC046570 TaxID=3155255 RepID=UPI0034001BA4
MTKTDFYDDPAAPKANSIVVAVTVAVINEEGRLLLIERSDSGLWALPGGAQDIGESVTQAAIREVREETGIEVEVKGLIGIYSDPRHVIAYDDGEVRQEFSICFQARPISGNLQTSSESRTVQWVEPLELSELPIHPSMRLRIEHAMRANEGPHLA